MFKELTLRDGSKLKKKLFSFLLPRTQLSILNILNLDSPNALPIGKELEVQEKSYYEKNIYGLVCFFSRHMSPIAQR